MKIYCVAGRYLRTQLEAKQHAKECNIPFRPEMDIVDWPTDQQGIVNALNDLVEGLVGAGAPAATQARYTEHVNGSVTDRSVAADEFFESLPLGQRLTLASLALEEARKHVGKLNVAVVAPPPADDLV